MKKELAEIGQQNEPSIYKQLIYDDELGDKTVQ